MEVPGISFLDASAPAAIDPNRMDVAMFLGFLPLRAGQEAVAARAALAERCARDGWKDRVAASGTDLVDLPVRVTSIEQVEQYFDTGARVNRLVSLLSAPLAANLELTEQDTHFVVNLDGQTQRVTLPIGPVTRSQIKDALDAGLVGVDVTEATETNGRASLQFNRSAAGAGSLTIYTHPMLGFAAAAFDQSQSVGAPTGAALRSFFASGGREAVIIRMADPVPLFATELQKVEALQRLVGEDYAQGASSIADLLTASLPQLPAEFPTRDPWHGLAHLHGLQDVTQILMPDLPDLTSTVRGAVHHQNAVPRPKEVFAPCAPEPQPSIDGAATLATPPSVDANGLELWSRIAIWAAEQVGQITPEAMVLCAVPLVDENAGDLTTHEALEIVKTGNNNQGMAHRQLQLVTPWIASAAAANMPSGAAPADGLLAGHIAASSLSVGAWRTVAGRSLPPGHTPYAAPSGVTFETTPQISIIGHGVKGPAILSDRTTDLGVYNQANIRRLTALIFRAARHRGESALFEPNGGRFWRSVQMSIASILRQLHSAGALRGLTEQDAFQVRCGPSTMSQADIDAGRGIAEVSFAPSHSLEFIEISLLAAQGSLQQQGIGL